MAIHDDILSTIGDTPVVKINRIPTHGSNLYVKVESFNPMGSVKDRMARAIIEAAERSGVLRPGQTVVEATSGNTGIALAMVCAAKGYPLVITMAENFSVERRKLMRFLGARVVLTPAAEKGSGMVAKAAELAEQNGWFLCRQFESEINAQAHSETTAREILADFPDGGLDAWVSGFGTGGTLLGVSRVLKSESPGTRIIACEPDNSPVLSSGVAQPRDPDSGAATGSHPMFRPHLMQGWSPDFIPGLVESAMSERVIDEIVVVSGTDALHNARELARREGIFVGISAGATVAGALQICRRLPAGSNVLCMLPDTGERYLSTVLFDDIGADMNEEERSISHSTNGYRFDAPAPPTAKDESTGGETDRAAERAVQEIVGTPRHPVTMFALTWCEFCWSVRKFFQHLGIDYHSVDLDSPTADLPVEAGRIRGALARMTGSPTIPQVFVGGQHIGGCTDLFAAWASGELQRRLERLGIDFRPTPGFRPEALLPSWLHTRAAS